MNPATMIFGSVSTGTVTLTAPAPAGGAVIALSSSDWVSFYLPASVTVPAGATTAQFPVTTRYREIDDGHHGELQRCEQDRNADVRLSNRDCVDLHTEPGYRR